MVKKKLGRGLEALLGETAEDGQERITLISADDIVPNPYQPRREFDEEALRELADSIRAKGILQPVTVRRAGAGYQIVAGERRWRAAVQAGLTEIPTIIRDFNDQDMAEAALMENILREDLSPVEEGQAYAELCSEFGCTQEEVAARIGKSRSHVANTLRLLTLPEEVQQMILTGLITAGQARPLLALRTPAEQISLARKIGKEGWSAREVEKFVSGEKKEKKAAPKEETQAGEYLRSVEQELGLAVGSKVQIKIGKGRNAHRGSVIISFKNDEEFRHITDILNQIK